MKKILYLLLVCFFIGSISYGQGTINCFPQSGDYNTGTTNGTEFTETSLINTLVLVTAGWAKFDITNIPAGSTIQSVELNLYVNADNYAYWYIMSLEEDPLNGTASSVHTDCTDGNMYASWEGSDFEEPGWFIADLGSDAVTTLQNSMADGWFGVGVWEFEAGGTYEITCDGWNEANPPFIKVTYLLAGAPMPAFNPDPPQNAIQVEIDKDLSWDFGADTETYDLYFGTDFPPATKVVDNATAGATGTYDPGILDFNTMHYWQVVSKNSAAELETPGPIWQFNTVCDAYAVPIFEDFETVVPPTLPDCWTGIANSVSGQAFIQSNTITGINESNSLVMDNQDDVFAELLFISPIIDGGAAGKYVNFWAWGSSNLSVGTIADPNDPSTFNEILMVTPSGLWLDYQEYEMFLDTYTGPDEFIAFKLVPIYTWAPVFIDDIIVDVAPTCPKPSDLYSSSTTTTSAILGWTENGTATQWNIEYGLFGFTPTGIPNATATTNPFDLTGLLPSSTYQFYVQADCGGGDVSYWVGPYSFQTQCETMDVPYTEGFETILPPDIPPCITVENTNGDFSEWYTADDNAYEGTNAIRVDYNWEMSMDDWFFSAPLNLTGGETYIVQFYYTSNSDSYIEKLEIMWGIDDTSSAMINGPIFTDTLINYAFTWYEGIGYFTPTDDGVYYIGWHGYSIPNQYNLYIDDIIIDIAPTCLKPTSLYTLEATSSSATLGWTESGTATQWNIEVGPAGFSPTGVPTDIADSNPFEITGLLAGTGYDFYVQADCGGGDVSWWAGPESFTTFCDPLDVPVEENFDLVVTPELPDCWRSLVITSGNSYINTIPYNALSMPNCLQIENGGDQDAEVYLVSPPISDTEGVAGKWIRFYVWGYAPEIVVGTMANPYDATTFNPVSVIPISNMYLNYQEVEAYFTNYTGSDEFIAIKGVYTGQWQTIYIDDMLIDHPPSCPKPSDLSVSDQTTSSALLHWIENGTSGLWNIEFGLQGFTPTGIPTVTVTENPYELTGLDPGTNYEFYVQADCGGGDLSDWAGPYAFETLCLPFGVPTFESFDNVIVPEIPNCWNTIVDASVPWAFIETNMWSPYSAPNSLFMSNSEDSEADLLLVSPQLTEPVSNLWINFFAFGFAPEISVGTITDPYDASTYTEIATVALTGIYLDYQEYEVFFDSYTGNDQFIALKGVFNGMWQDISIDNITIDHPPTCPKPQDPYANSATTNSIMLGWTEMGTATQWNIEYDLAGFTPTGVANATASTNPYEITGLDDGTLYEYYVQADCGGGDVSYWVGPVIFQTLCFPTTLPYEEGFEDIIPPLTPPCIIVENTNNDDILWYGSNMNPNNGNYHIAIGWNGSLPMNDWFFSAPLELLGGQTYNVNFFYTNNSDYYVEKLEVLWGTEPVSDSMTNGPIWIDENILYNYVYQEASTSFSPPTDGIYYVGWHGYSIANQYDIYVDDIFIEWDNSLVVTALATPDTICEGESSQLNGSAVGGSGNYSYSWTSDPPGFTSTDPDPIVSPVVTTDYILEVYDGWVSIFDTVTVNVIALPGVPGTPGGIALFCASWVNASYSTTGTTNANWYDWELDPPDAGEISGTGTSIIITWTDGWLGNANLTVTGMHDNCAGPSSSALTVVVYLPDVTLAPLGIVGIEWEPFELTGGDPAGGDYSGPGVTDNWFYPAVAGLGDHVITYTYTDLNLCTNSAEGTITVSEDVGINGQSLPLDVSILPNPNNGLFILKVNTRVSEKVNIRIVDSYSEEVYSINNVMIHRNFTDNLDLSDYARGLYYLYIYSDNINHVEKIVIK